MRRIKMESNYDFSARADKIGKFTLIAGLIANFVPALYLAGVVGVMPQFTDLLQIYAVAFSAFGVSWLVQPLSFYPMLGVGGSYIGWLTGNVADIRVPAATMAQRTAGAEPGSPEGDVMATIGIASSTFVSVAIITLFTLIGAAIMPMVPKFVTKAFGFILPAVFGAVYAELSRKHLKIGVLTIILGLAITFFGPKLGVPRALVTILVIAGGVAMARVHFLNSK
jgi:small basic protein